MDVHYRGYCSCGQQIEVTHHYRNGIYLDQLEVQCPQCHLFAVLQPVRLDDG